METEILKSKPLSKEETKSLLEMIEKSSIITCKSTNATNNKMKNDEWISITSKFNSISTTGRRTPQQLRLKWENLKKSSRKRSTKIRMNHLQTGGGVADYIPPDDILDRVASLLGSTVSGFVVPFGGDKEPEEFAKIDGGGSDISGDGYAGGDGNFGAGLTFSNEIESPMPIIIEEDIVVTECNQFDGSQLTMHTADKPKRLTFNTPRTGKKRKTSESKTANSRNQAIADYYTVKKQCLHAKLEGIHLENEKFKLENEKLKLENEKLKLEIEKLKQL